MSSPRYPFGCAAPWFPGRITVRVPTGRDAFGRATGVAETTHPAKVTITPVEAIEGGMRVVRDGIAGKTAAAVAVGTELSWKGQLYTVTQVAAAPDHTDETHAWSFWAVVKRGTN